MHQSTTASANLYTTGARHGNNNSINSSGLHCTPSPHPSPNSSSSSSSIKSSASDSVDSIANNSSPFNKLVSMFPNNAAIAAAVASTAGLTPFSIESLLATTTATTSATTATTSPSPSSASSSSCASHHHYQHLLPPPPPQMRHQHQQHHHQQQQQHHHLAGNPASAVLAAAAFFATNQSFQSSMSTPPPSQPPPPAPDSYGMNLILYKIHTFMLLFLHCDIHLFARTAPLSCCDCYVVITDERIFQAVYVRLGFFLNKKTKITRPILLRLII